MKTYEKVMYALLIAGMAVCAVYGFVTDGFTYGMAYVNVALWVGVAWMQRQRAEDYRQKYEESLRIAKDLIAKLEGKDK